MTYFIRRFVAIYIDALIVFILSNLVYTMGQLLIGVGFMNIKTPNPDNMLMLDFFIFVIYFCFAEFFKNRTLGKFLLKLEIVGFENIKGTKLIKQILLRNLIRLIPIEPFSIFLNENHRMWHDLISKTTVVDIRKTN